MKKILRNGPFRGGRTSLCAEQEQTGISNHAAPAIGDDTRAVTTSLEIDIDAGVPILAITLRDTRNRSANRSTKNTLWFI